MKKARDESLEAYKKRQFYKMRHRLYWPRKFTGGGWPEE